MRKYIHICLVLFTLLGCEDVIEVDVPTEEPRLIIDALIRIDESQTSINIKIKVGLTGNFFGTLPVTDLEQITIMNLAGDTFDGANILILLENTPGSGIYEKLTTPAFFKENEGELLLQIKHKGRIYLATTYYAPAVPIDNLEQGEGTLFNEDDTEIIVTYTDEPDREDFYLFDFGFNNYEVTEDTFYQGQEIQFSYFYDEELNPGREIDVSILGADRTFYNYMSQLIEVSRGDFNVFSTPVATIRGNIFDVTDIDNRDTFDNVEQPNLFPLGYFAVVQEYTESIVIE